MLALFPDISETTVERTLRKMCDADMIGMIGSGKSTRYVPKENPKD